VKQYKLTNGEREMFVFENMLDAWLNAGYTVVDAEDISEPVVLETSEEQEI
jgi:hypothetical protein